MCVWYSTPDAILLSGTEIYSGDLRNGRFFIKIWMKIRKSGIWSCIWLLYENLEKSAPPGFKKERTQWYRRLPVSESILTALTNYHRPLGLTREIYFSQFWRLEVWDQDAVTVPFWREPSSRLQMADFSLYPHVGERGKGALLCLFHIRALIPLMRVIPS